jgi:N-acetylneuraminic acid mutarotase
MSGSRSIAGARIQTSSSSLTFGLFLAALVAAPQLGCGGSSVGGPQTVAPPAGLSYANSPATYTKGAAIAANAPRSTGGAVASYAVSPNLPAGLSLDTTTGVISGTPGAVTALTAYTVTARNAGGSTTCSVVLAVNDVPPSGLSYPHNAVTYTRGVAIAPDVPTVSGGAVTRYSVSPALPAGLTIDPATGVFSGTPGAVAASGNYFITAINSGGTSSFELTITVNDQAPSGLTYASNPVVYVSGIGIAPNRPSNSGGAVVSYRVSPALPSRLSLDAGTGVISGTPGAPVASNLYFVTATNSGGSTAATLTITVNAQPPTNLAYPDNAPVYTRGVAITPDVPTNGGGTVVSYSVSPLLPTGLLLDPNSGVISGTPSVVSAATPYTVTATNTGGSTTATVTIAVREPPPAALVYATNPTQYSVGVPIQPDVPSNGGGIITSYSVSPALPDGLSFDPLTGIISGTPTTVTAQAHYVITGSNVSGSTICDFVTAVGPSPIPPPDTPLVTAGTYVTTGQPGYQASTQDQGTANGTTYLWTLANGSITGGQGTPAITYAAGAVGSLTITVKVSNLAGSATGGATVTVVDVPAVKIFAQQQVLVGMRARASVPAQANMTYSWSLTGASAGTITSGTSNVVDYTAGLTPGAYQVSVTVQSPVGSSASATRDLQVVENAFEADAHSARQRYGNTVTVLLDGRVLVAGGDDFQITGSGTADLYDPWSNTWTTTGPMTAMRSFHAATVLADGRVLVIGGVDPAGVIFDNAEIYDPSANAWTPAGTMNATRQNQTATLLPNSTVLVAGGYGVDSGGTTGGYLDSADIYDPATQTFNQVGPMSSARTQHTATLLRNGLVLLAAGAKGSNTGGWLNTADLYDPTRQSFTLTKFGLKTARVDHTASLLSSGKVLVAGGRSASAALPNGEVFDPATETWGSTANSMASGHAEHAAATLPSGKVLVIGGSSDSSQGQVESYDPVTNRWTPVQNLVAGRTYVSGTLLPTGQALVVGGRTHDPIASPELYDATANTWTSGGSWSSSRTYHTATTLTDGTLLVAGGQGDTTTYMTLAERYDPVAGVWTTASNLNQGRIDHAAALLSDGRVLVVGGIAGGSATSSAEIYTPGSNSWTFTGSLTAPRAYPSATGLPNGKVLVAGGSNGSPTLATAELYDPAGNGGLGSWSSAGSMSSARVGHTATLLPNGKVLVTGGGTSNTVVNTADIYDPATNTWSPAAPMISPRKYHTATLLPDGTVLALGGQQTSLTTAATAERYDPATDTWTPSVSMSAQRYSHAATQLPDGRVLVSGGVVSSPLTNNTADLYDPVAQTTTSVPMVVKRAYHTATLLDSAGTVLILGGTRGSTPEYWKP